MNKPEIWAYLIHLGTNCWRQKGQASSRFRDEEDAIYRDKLYCDKETWNKVTAFLPTCGINTLLIDVADAVQYERHPELAVEGAWTKAELKEELARLRMLGLNPIPKCNFSCGHDAWLGEYSYMVGTEAYNQCCKDIVEELIEVFDTPAFFHLGLEEEDAVNQSNQSVIVVRSVEKKTEDALFLFDVCRSKGVRPWIWIDNGTINAFGGAEAFCANIPKDVLLSNWYYNQVRNEPDVMEKNKAAKLYKDCGDWGYEQVPTSSTWCWHLNSKETMRFCQKHVDPASIKGFMTAPWQFTVPKKYYALLNDAFTFGNAKADIYGE